MWNNFWTKHSHNVTKCSADGNVVLLHNFGSHDFFTSCHMTSLLVMWLSIKPPKLAFCWAFHLLTRRTRTHLCLHTRVTMHACLAVEFWSSSECILCTMQCMIRCFVCHVTYVHAHQHQQLESWEAVNETWMDDGNLIMINYSHDVAVMFCHVPVSTVASRVRVLWSSQEVPKWVLDCLYYLRKGGLF